ncbi:class I SAM-dependent methyltransferase [Thermodesulfobacteriota bacterium]
MNEPDPVRTTLDYYESNAKAFFENTVSVDMTSLYRPFLDLVPQAGAILDAGCGSGRDSKYFINNGFKVVAFDYSPELVRLASEHIGQDVLLLSFDDLNFEKQFDGVWACASMLHLPKQKMSVALSKLKNALKNNGILYASFKYGDAELYRNNRYFSDYDEESFNELLKDHLRFTPIKYWKTSDLRPEREHEKWLNILLRKEM